MDKEQLRSGKRVSNLIGMPVFTLNKGERIGKIKDVVYDIEQSRVNALTIEEPGVFSPRRYILFLDRISSIGTDAVMIEKSDVLTNERVQPGLRRTIDRQNRIVGKKILTEGGSDLGNISDIFINPDTGDAVSYEVTGGLAQDIGSGRNYVAAADAKTIGPGVVIVPDTIENTLQVQADEEPGGLTGAYREASTRARQYTEDQEVSLSRGKTAGRDVLDDEGSLVVAKGDTITDEVIERARYADKMHQLALAAGVGGVSAGYERASEAAYGAAGKQLLGKIVPRDVYDAEGRVVIPQGIIISQETLDLARSRGVSGKLASIVLGEQARGRAGSFWGETRDRFSEAWSNMTDRSREAVDDAGRKRAVSAQKDFLKGKISASDVRDDQGNILLHEGEVITPLVLDTLDRQGKLEQVSLIPAGQAAEGIEDGEEHTEIHVVVESEAQHARHAKREKTSM